MPRPTANFLPNELAVLTDRVPFYLERVVARLAELEGPVSVKDARQIVRQHLTDDDNVWEMEHFRSRLKIYYHGSSNDANGRPLSKASLASAILDILAIVPEQANDRRGVGGDESQNGVGQSRSDHPTAQVAGPGPLPDERSGKTLFIPLSFDPAMVGLGTGDFLMNRRPVVSAYTPSNTDREVLKRTSFSANVCWTRSSTDSPEAC